MHPYSNRVSKNKRRVFKYTSAFGGPVHVLAISVGIIAAIGHSSDLYGGRYLTHYSGVDWIPNVKDRSGSRSALPD